MKLEDWFKITTGRRVLLSIIVPVLCGLVLWPTKVYSDIYDTKTGQKVLGIWKTSNLRDYYWVDGLFALVTIAWLWWLWREKKTDDKSSA